MFRGRLVPPAALVGGVDPENVQLLFAALLGFGVEEVLAVLVQVVDQVPVETVLSDDVDGAWGVMGGCVGGQQINIGVSLWANLIRGW